MQNFLAKMFYFSKECLILHREMYLCKVKLRNNYAKSQDFVAIWSMLKLI